MLLSHGPSKPSLLFQCTYRSTPGKSVICSKIINYINENPPLVVIFYFCKSFSISRRLSTEVLRAFAAQLLVANTDIAPYILDTFANQGRQPTKKSLGIIFERLLISLASVRIVFDGIDECPQADQDEVMDDILRIRGSPPGSCKILFSSRRVATLSRQLQAKPALRLEDHTESVHSMIAHFVRSRLESLRERFSANLIDELECQLLAKAKGKTFVPKLRSMLTDPLQGCSFGSSSSL